MITSADILRVLNALPPPLRRLLEAEISAGNYVVEITQPKRDTNEPLRVWLANHVTSKPRIASSEILSREANPAEPHGEFSDPERRWIIVESCRSPADEPDMNAIRASFDALELASNANRFKPDGGLW